MIKPISALATSHPVAIANVTVGVPQHTALAAVFARSLKTVTNSAVDRPQVADNSIERFIAGVADRAAGTRPVSWLYAKFRDALCPPRDDVTMRKGKAEAPHSVREQSLSDARGSRRVERAASSFEAVDVSHGGGGLDDVDCASALNSVPATGGSNKAAIVDVKEGGSVVRYRVKNSRGNKDWLETFEPELANSLQLESDFYPAMEIAMSQIFKATGLEAPLLRRGRNCHSVIYPGAERPLQEPMYVMSNYDDNYMDLGRFVRSEQGRMAILAPYSPGSNQYLELLREHDSTNQKHDHAVDSQKKLLDGKKFYEIGYRENGALNAYRDKDHIRFSSLEKNNKKLPDHLVREQEVHYMMARFVCSWDHLNYRMENFGYTKIRGKWVGKTIDFDTTGPLGYGGLPKTHGKKLADAQRPAALFKLPRKVSNYDNFSSHSRADLIGIERQPYGEQSKTSIERVVEALESVTADAKERLLDDPRYQSALEFGYRLSRLEDGVIDAIAQKNWFDAPKEFELTKDTFIDIVKKRRDSMIKQVGRELIGKWVQRNPASAAQIDGQILQALVEMHYARKTLEDVQFD